MFKYKRLLYNHFLQENFPTESFENHAEPIFEILFFLQGKASFNIEGKLFPLKPYDLAIIPANLFHFLVFDDNKIYERFMFKFKLMANDDPTLTEIYSIPRVINMRNNNHLMNLFHRAKQYYHVFNENDLHSIMDALFQEFQILLKQVDLENTSSTNYIISNPVVLQMIQLISENLSEDLSPDFFAKRLFLSTSYLKHLFCKHMHVGLNHYINNQRILKARSLIKGGSKPTHIFKQCGFDSYSTFYREYKHFIGKTPQQDAPLDLTYKQNSVYNPYNPL